jgi:hypothetical protein
MSKVLEMNKRQIVLDDGRYLIFYTFGPSESLSPRDAAVPIAEATADEREKEN